MSMYLMFTSGKQIAGIPVLKSRNIASTSVGTNCSRRCLLLIGRQSVGDPKMTSKHNRSYRPISSLLWIILAVGGLSTLAPRVDAQQQADNTYIEAATLYQQALGEARALEYQTYMLARMLLDRDLRNHRIRMRRAIIVDVDETILDNSRYQGMLIKKGVNYPEGWTDWCNRAEATPIPGAVDFLKYAHARGVRVFYVTNRKIAEKDGTARNLKSLGFPEVNDQTLLVRTDTQSDSKEPRRQSIASRYHVVRSEE